MSLYLGFAICTIGQKIHIVVRHFVSVKIFKSMIFPCVSFMEKASNVVINCSVGVYSGGLGPDWAPRQRGRSQEKEQQAGRGGYSINRQKDEAKLICETTTFKVVFA
jgi:hypothetical protein